MNDNPNPNANPNPNPDPDAGSEPRLRPAARWATGLAIGLAGLTTVVGLVACGTEDGSGDIVTLTLSNESATPITSIVLDADMDLRVVVAPNVTQGAMLRIDDNLVDHIDASIGDEGELYVGYYDGLAGDLSPSQQPQLTLSVQSLDAIENRDDGAVVVAGVDEDDLEIVNDGNGSIEVLR
jgi:hypothetical protein